MLFFSKDKVTIKKLISSIWWSLLLAQQKFHTAITMNIYICDIYALESPNATDSRMVHLRLWLFSLYFSLAHYLIHRWNKSWEWWLRHSWNGRNSVAENASELWVQKSNFSWIKLSEMNVDIWINTQKSYNLIEVKDKNSKNHDFSYPI